MYHQFYTIDVIERDMRALLDLIDDSNIVDANERVPIEICAWSLAIALEEHERPIWGFMCQDVDDPVQYTWRAFLFTSTRLLMAYSGELDDGYESELKGVESFDVRSISKLDYSVEDNEILIELGWGKPPERRYNVHFNVRNAVVKVHDGILKTMGKLHINQLPIPPAGRPVINPPCCQRLLCNHKSVQQDAKEGGLVALVATSLEESKDLYLGDVDFKEMDFPNTLRPSYTARCCVLENKGGYFNEQALRESMQHVLDFAKDGALRVGVPSDFLKIGRGKDVRAIVTECLHSLTSLPMGVVYYFAW